MPKAMCSPQAVTVEGILYINDIGGLCHGCYIHRYDLQTQKWLELLQYQYRQFTMTAVSSQLTLVGGRDVSTGKSINTVAVYSTSQRSWKQSYPPMNTPRYLPAVSTYRQHLVIAGGRDHPYGTDLALVEILDTSSPHSQWVSVTPLPVSCRQMSAAIIQDTLYLLGGTLGNKVLSLSLLNLTQTAEPPTQWCTLSDTPLEHSTAIAAHGSLLVVGGSHGGQRKSAIHMYDQEKNAWNKVGDLCTERESCACCLLPSGEILVAGGGGSTSQVDVATVSCSHST